MATKQDRPADPVARERARVLDALEPEATAFAARDAAFECAQHAAEF